MQNTKQARILEIVNSNYSVSLTNPGLQAGGQTHHTDTRGL